MYGNGYGMNGFNPYQNGGAMNDVLSQYKGPYQTPMGIPGMPQQMMPQVPTEPNRAQGNGTIWVQGESGARAYLVAPNTTVVLWDSENPTIYLKSADANGMPSMRILDFTERGVPSKSQGNGEEKHECQCGKDFVKIEAFNELSAKYEKLEGIVNSILKEREDA